MSANASPNPETAQPAHPTGETAGPTRPSRPYRPLALVCGCLLLAFTLRIYHLGDKNIWWDEGLVVVPARLSLREMTRWTAGDIHPPLYLWGVWFWKRLTGETEFALRYFSLLWGVLTVAVLYPLGRRLANRSVAILAMLYLSLSRFHIWWSQELRMYILAGLTLLLAWYFLLPLIQTPATNRTRAAYIGAATSALYTLYLAGATLVAQNLFALAYLITFRKWSSLRSWILTQLAIAGLFLPWIWLAFPHLKRGNVTETPAAFSFVMQLFSTLMAVGISTHLERYWLPSLVIAGLGVGGLGFLLRQRQGRKAALLFGLGLGIPLVAIWGFTHPNALIYTPRVEARYFVPSAALFYLLLGWSGVLLWQRSRWMGAPALLLPLLLAIWALPGHYQERYLRDELQSMVRTIWAYAQPGDAVLLVSGDRFPIFDYYYGRPPAPPHRPPIYRLPRMAYQVTEATVDRELEDLLAAHPRLWLASVEAALQDPGGLLEKRLDQRRIVSWRQVFGHNKLKLYTEQPATLFVPAENLIPQFPVNWQPHFGLQLQGFDLPGKVYRAGDVIHLALYWTVQQPTQVSVLLVQNPDHVEDEQTIELQPVPTGFARSEVEFVIAPTLKSGEYYLALSMPPATERDTSSQHFRLRPVRIDSRLSIPAIKHIPHPMQITLGDGINFVGYGLRTEGKGPVTGVHPGEALYLDLYWEARAPVNRRYTVFTHLIGSAHNPATAGPVWGQHDGPPAGGQFPTDRWPVGTVIPDPHVLWVDPKAPPGEYWLEVGMYLLETGERLPVLDTNGQVTDDRILLQPLQVLESNE